MPEARHNLLQGDAVDLLRSLPDESVHCCVTSPPYFGLRDYGVDGQIGLEETPDEYVARIVNVFREVRRVLRNDGTCWINIGDSYAANGGAHGGRSDNQRGVGARRAHEAGAGDQSRRRSPSGLKPKDLLGIPWRVAFALQADGWWLRQDIIWHKPNPMPESVRDRCTKAHEYVFLLTKGERYFYDAEAISETAVCDRMRGPALHPDTVSTNGNSGLSRREFTGTRNRRSVWSITTKPYKGAHFATMPTTLAEPCIKAGTSERGCCPECGSPWSRVTEREKLTRPRPNDYVKRTGEDGTGNSCANSVAGVRVTTTGWSPSCKCGRDEAVPCTVIDPFSGSGTTVAVAASLGRSGIGIELNPGYIELAKKRVSESVTLFT